MKRFREIIQGIKAPSTSDLWINDGKLKYFNNGAWENLGSSEYVQWDDIQGAPIISNGDGTKYLADDGHYKAIEPSGSYLVDATTYNYEGFMKLRDSILSNKVIIFKSEYENTSLYYCTKSTCVSSNRKIYLSFIDGNVSNDLILKLEDDNSVTTEINSYIMVFTSPSIQAGRVPVSVSTNEGYVWSEITATAVPNTPTGEAATAENVANTLNALLASLREGGIIQK